MPANQRQHAVKATTLNKWVHYCQATTGYAYSHLVFDEDYSYAALALLVPFALLFVDSTSI